jgi:hypothetical protein
VLVEHAGRRRQVLGVAADVGADEDRPGVPLHHAIPLGDHLFARREALAVEAPVRMTPQLHPALVGAVHGSEERHRVGAVDQHGHPEPAALGPDRVQARIVDGDQSTGGVADAQAEVLEDLQAPHPAPAGVAQHRGDLLAEAGLVDRREVDVAEDDQPVRRGVVEPLEHPRQLLAPPAAEVDRAQDVPLVHRPQHGLRVLLERPVAVDVHRRVPRPLDGRDRRDERRLRAVVAHRVLAHVDHRADLARRRPSLANGSAAPPPSRRSPPRSPPSVPRSCSRHRPPFPARGDRSELAS